MASLGLDSFLNILSETPFTPESSRRKRPNPDARVACLGCRQGKTRCIQDQGQNACQRCTTSGQPCIWPQSQRGKWKRKRRISSGESALEINAVGALDQMDDSVSSEPQPEVDPIIVSGSEQIRNHNGRLHFKLAHQVPPMGVLAEASMRLGDHLQGRSFAPNEGRLPVSSAAALDSVPRDPGRLGEHKLLGMANNGYFAHSLQKHLRPKRQERTFPSIVAKEIITVEQSRNLFHLFFKHCNSLVGLLDERVINSGLCATKSPFLFTVVCAVASRYWPKSETLFPKLMAEAHREGMEAMCRSKSTATVQGFLLLSWWNQPTSSYEDDNTFTYAGIAIRMAYEINLYHRTVINFPAGFNETVKRQYELEMLNRERTMQCVFITDRLTMVISGKPDSALESNVIRNAFQNLYPEHRTAANIKLCAQIDLLRMVTRFFYVMYSSTEVLSGMRSAADYSIVRRDVNTRIDDWYKQWSLALQEKQSDERYSLYLALIQIDMHACKIALNNICLSMILETDPHSMESIEFALPCFISASSLLQIVQDTLSGLGVLKYAPDHIFICIAYSATMLFKLERSAVSHLFDPEKVLEQIYAVILALENAAEDETHAPMLYAIFLRKQLAEYQEKESTIHNVINTEAPPIIQSNSATENFPELFSIASEHASGSNMDPFNPEGLFDTTWLDTLLTSQTSLVTPHADASDAAFWDLFRVSESDYFFPDTQ